MTKTDQAKERLRQHLTHLNATGYIDPYQLIRDKVYYYKEVMSALNILGITNDSGRKLKDFDVEAFIFALHETKNKNVKQIAPQKAKSIGQKMSKSRIDMKEIIKQNSTPTYEDRAALDMEHCVDVKPKANPLEKFSVEDICLELSRRGYRGSMTYSL